tara:strand:+ start:4449 stop:4928 length:480 start_codon:yes stop_codon:yes gene_type:complete
MNVNISKVSVRSSKGEDVELSRYRGKVLLIVNVASKCGFTKQYEALQEIQNQYESQGFEVLGFPCNDFGAQEPGSLTEIKNFCSTTYGATFTLFEKVHAKGETTEPYTTLNQTEPSGDVAWNFEKFLISKSGNVLRRFKSSTEPDSAELKEAIEKALVD